MVETKSSMPWVLYGFCCCNHVEIVETVQPRGGWIRDMKVKETFEALFSWYYFEITDLTWLLNNYYLITCNMCSLDMSCLNPWPFHPLTNALLKDLVSLNKSLLLTPESVYSQGKGEVFACLGYTAAVFGVYQPTAGVCCPHSPDLVRTEVVVLQISQLLRGKPRAPTGQGWANHHRESNRLPRLPNNLKAESWNEFIFIHFHWFAEAKSLAPLVSGRILADSWDIFP